MIRKATAALDDDLAADIEKVLADAAPNITPGQLSDLAAIVKPAAAPDDADADAKKTVTTKNSTSPRRSTASTASTAGSTPKPAPKSPPPSKHSPRKRDPNFSRFEDPIGKRRAEALLMLASARSSIGWPASRDAP